MEKLKARLKNMQHINNDRLMADHLVSAEWAAMRQLVLARDNYLCQGCLKRQATVIHHKTYKSKLAELAFELVSLCEPCHARAPSPPKHGRSL